MSVADNKRQMILLIASSLVIAGSIAAIYQTQYASPRNERLRPHVAVGEALAAEVARLVGNQGQIVIVSEDIAQSRELRAEVEAFRSSLQKLGSITIAATETCRIPARSSYRSVPSGDLMDLFRRYPRVNAIVSFAGAPALDQTQVASLDKKRPAFAAVCRVRIGLDRLFAQEVIHVAVVPRFVYPAPVTELKTNREWFDKFYQVVRGEGDLGATK
jgi:hypothetical protein